MGLGRLATGMDDRIGAVGERIARAVNRRDALRRVVVGGTAGLAALAVGSNPAQAASASCWCGPTRRCDHCPGIGCPSGHHLCTSSTAGGNCFNGQGFRCEWPHGSWIACMGLGKGLGYRVCYDCIGRTGCSHWCTCLSECICCRCANPADVRAEQRRIQQSLAR